MLEQMQRHRLISQHFLRVLDIIVNNISRRQNLSQHTLHTRLTHLLRDDLRELIRTLKHNIAESQQIHSTLPKTERRPERLNRPCRCHRRTHRLLVRNWQLPQHSTRRSITRHQYAPLHLPAISDYLLNCILFKPHVSSSFVVYKAIRKYQKEKVETASSYHVGEIRNNVALHCLLPYGTM